MTKVRARAARFAFALSLLGSLSFGVGTAFAKPAGAASNCPWDPFNGRYGLSCPSGTHSECTQQCTAYNGGAPTRGFCGSGCCTCQA